MPYGPLLLTAGRASRLLKAMGNERRLLVLWQPVEVEGQRVLQPSCIVKAGAGMKVQTRSEKVVRARKTILEMLASSVDLSDSPGILTMMDEYGATAERFPEAERRESVSMALRYVLRVAKSICARSVCRRNVASTGR